MNYIVISFITLLLCLSCQAKPSTKKDGLEEETSIKPIDSINETFNSNVKTIHILVALCDNKYQGIVPVPNSIGNGQSPKSNLYWGAAFGIKTYFKKSKQWSLMKAYKVDSVILERLVFKHKNENYFIVADAYDGKYIKQTTEDFLSYHAGMEKDTILVKDQVIDTKGNSCLIAYIGHNGLMDFNLNKTFLNKDNKTRDAIILACYSKSYFYEYLKTTKSNPLVWSTHLMAPEAYTIHDALDGFIKKESNKEIRLRAALAYSKYQKCSLNAAKNLLVSDY